MVLSVPFRLHRHPTLWETTPDRPPTARLVRRLSWVGGSLACLVLGSSAALAHIVTSPRHLRSIEQRKPSTAVQEIAFRTTDNLTLHGWYLPHPQPRDVLILCHGYAMSRHELLDLAEDLRQRGHAMVLFDFRGHGTSEGRRSTIGVRESGDVIAALDFVQAQPELAQLPIGVAGISMGGAASLLAAARDERIAAVAADSSFAALADTARGNLRALSHAVVTPLSPLVIRFSELFTHVRIGLNRPVDAIAALAPRPVLIIHDSEDTFIPVTNALALHTAASTPKELWISPGRGHASLLACQPAEYARRLHQFFTAALAPAPATSTAASHQVA